MAIIRNYQNLTLKPNNNVEAVETIVNKWFSTFPLNRSNLFLSNILTYNVRSPMEELETMLNTLSTSLYYPDKANKWGSVSGKQYGLSPGVFGRNIKNNIAGASISLNNTDLVIDITERWGKYVNGGYSYGWGFENLQDKLGSKNIYYIELKGSAHIYSRRARPNLIYILPNVNDADIYIHVKEYTKLTYYVDYGDIVEVFRVPGKNNRIILILDARLDLWANRAGYPHAVFHGGTNNSLVIVNPENLWMDQYCYNSCTIFGTLLKDQRVAVTRLTNNNKINVVTDNKLWGYTLPWTS